MSNQTFALREEYTNMKLIRKVLRSLLERFSIKVTTMEEAKDLESLEIADLMSKEDSSNNSELDEDHLSNFVSFIASTIIRLEDDCDEDFDSGFDKEFLKTYKIILGK
ncbi:hypothetical protein CXB51_003552 [Gossypium anomalum]|uniref:Uncharacterized protein n=1 Tax=Gossypium anomalum TaxID=47600 RepID=A0A8J5Z634_9ROSI|nr:hypothetical protein CXB51_003552 [Gossypium anomalum]